MHSNAHRIRLGLLGCGNVGAAFANLVADQASAIADRTGVALEVTRVAVRSTSRHREVALSPDVFTHDAEAVVTDPDVDVVVELIGGIEPARQLILAALKAGKPVITANKELLANVGPELYTAAANAGVDLLFEAAVGGGIPLIRPLRESLVGEKISRILGIVNGTTNYILTAMTAQGATYADALAEAQSLGYAERDPTADVEGFDAAAKASILASIAFGASVFAGDVYREGISGITETDIHYAERLGYRIKLLAIAEEFPDETVAVRVHPAMVPLSHPLAAVSGSFNAVFVEGRAVGELMFYGRGAGGNPSASAVLGDVIDASSNLLRGAHASIGTLRSARLRPIDDLEAAFYLHLELVDRPGVLAQVAEVFGRHAVSIRSLEQETLGESARCVFITHRAVESDFQATLAELATLSAVRRVVGVLRVVGE